jgi:hypothetical protein
MLVLERSDKAAAMLVLAERHLDAEREPGWHVSDLVQCLRKTYYDKNPEYAREPGPDDRAIFLLGKSQHVIIQAANGGTEVKVRLMLPEEVHGTVDVYLPDTSLFEWPTEIKTTRSHDIKEPAFGMPQYIEQLAAYCLATRNQTGTLAVWYIFAMPPMLRVWDITFSDQELNAFNAELAMRLSLISQDDTIPSVNEHRHGECKTCRYFKKNGGGPCLGSMDYRGRENFFLQSNYTSLEGS